MTYLTSDPGISLDGYIAGPVQTLENPLALGAGEALFTDLKGLSFEVVSSRSTSMVTHVTLKRIRG